MYCLPRLESILAHYDKNYKATTVVLPSSLSKWKDTDLDWISDLESLQSYILAELEISIHPRLIGHFDGKK